MIFEEILREILNRRDIMYLCSVCSGSANDSAKAELFSLINHPDDRTAYNALWVFTYLADDDIAWLRDKRTELIAIALNTSHTGKRRLALTLLERLPTRAVDVSADYLDFCLSKINSTEPYGVRALCLKQAFAMCRFYPELTTELEAVIELMERGPLSPGLCSARRQIIRKLEALGSR